MNPITASESIEPGDTDIAPTRAELTERLLQRRERCTGAEAEEITRRIIEVNLDLARTLARRYYGHGELSEDLDQIAYLGLTLAVGRFEPARGKNFLAFAVPTIRGELRRHFRDSCWMVRPPRRVQEIQGRMMPMIEAFAQANGRDPDPERIAEQLEVDTDDVVEALTAEGCFTPTSLQRPVQPSNDTELGDLIGQDDPQFRRMELHELLKPLIERLPRRERQIIELRFFWDWKQQQIADEVGLTQMQISRILTAIMERLRLQLTAHAAPAARPVAA